MGFRIHRDFYAALYGPGVGDLVRLGDTNLCVRVDRSLIPLGEEGLVGAGRNLRDGMGVFPSNQRESALDVCIKSVLVVDPVLGVVKADIGIKGDRIVGIGFAGNPDVQDGVDMVLDTNTQIMPAAGLIATAGLIDTHVHLTNGSIMDHFVRLGYTTLIGGSAGMMFDVGSGPREVMLRMFDSVSAFPVNMAFLTRAASTRAPLEEMLEWGSSGFKIHEDLGAYPAVIDTTLGVSDDYDVQTIIHTDTINEAVSLEDTVAAIAGRTIHAYHIEGAGGGHAPDLLELVSVPNVLPSSTNPTNPFTASAVREHLDMIMTCHLQTTRLPEDVAFAQSRIRPETMAAEDVLHDIGAISMMSSDSVGMGHAGESARRALQLAHAMKHRLEGDRGSPRDDNERVLRYVAKMTVNPAIAHGLADHVGLLAPGLLADIVLWRPGWFGAKPEMVFKSGFPTIAMEGHGNGTTPYVQPTMIRPTFGSFGGACTVLGRFFVANATLDNPRLATSPHRSRMLGVAGTRLLRKDQMVRNGALPSVRVDRDSFQVYVDGRHTYVEPVTEVPLSRRYWLL